jgi:hypothetical protein
VLDVEHRKGMMRQRRIAGRHHGADQDRSSSQAHMFLRSGQGLGTDDYFPFRLSKKVLSFDTVLAVLIT